MRLDGKTAIVTGGCNGIGQAVVRNFAAEGARVLIADLADGPGLALEKELNQEERRVKFVKTNVSVSEDVQAAVQAAVDTFGRLDILVNDAGIVEQDVMLEDEAVEEWDRVLGVDLHGTFLFCKYALPRLRETKGRIVNVASISGLTATHYCAAYCAAKAAVIGFTRAIAADYAPYEVRANCVCPSACETPMMKNYFAAFPQDVVEEKIARLSGPVKRMCSPDEIAKGILFLASEQDSPYTSGMAMPIDGGYTAV